MSLPDMPAGYLDHVRIQAYHLDLTLHCYPPADHDQQQQQFDVILPAPTFSGRVKILATVKSGPPRNVFYFHQTGLKISRATVDGVSATVAIMGGSMVDCHQSDRGNNNNALPRLTRVEIPVNAAIAAGAAVEIEMEFAGRVKVRAPEGVSMLRRQNDIVDKLKPVVAVARSASTTSTMDGTASSTSTVSDTDDRRSNSVSGDTASGVGSDNNSAEPRHGHTHVPESFFPVGAVLGTHLEPTHARDLFPCIDFPSCKAVFHLTLRGVPRHLSAISNSPISRVDNCESGPHGADFTAREEALRPDGPLRPISPPHQPQQLQSGVDDVTSEEVGVPASFPRKDRGLKTVVFEPTPIMPTYIFGFWVGDFHFLTTQAWGTEESRTSPLFCCGGTPVPSLPNSSKFEVTINAQVLRPAGLEGASFALDFSRRAFEFFSRLFSVPYPLPKLDVLGLPRMHGLGMENFGAITLLEVRLLSSPSSHPPPPPMLLFCLRGGVVSCAHLRGRATYRRVPKAFRWLLKCSR